MDNLDKSAQSGQVRKDKLIVDSFKRNRLKKVRFKNGGKQFVALNFKIKKFYSLAAKSIEVFTLSSERTKTLLGPRKVKVCPFQKEKHPVSLNKVIHLLIQPYK